MPKKIYDQSSFIRGISDNDKEENYSMRDIDVFRDYGYLVPGFLKSDITVTGLTSDIIEIINDPVNSRAYLLGNSARIYGLDTSTDADIGITFGGGAQNYVTVSAMTEAKGLIVYVTEDSAYRVLFAFNGTNKDIAKGVLTNSWDGANLDQDWGSTRPSGATLQVGRRDMIEWNTYVWVTNGRYIGKIDTLAATADFYPTNFDLGLNWTADRLFTTSNYLGIIASKSRSTTSPGSIYAPSSGRNVNECRIYLWDGNSALPAKTISLDGITQVHSVINKNGTIILFADDRSAGHIVAVLGENGLEEVKRLKQDISGTLTSLLSPRSQSSVTLYKNQILFGTEGKGLVMGYGRKDIKKDYILFQPTSLSTGSSSKTTSLKQIYTDKLYAGYFDGTNYKFTKLSTGYSTSANYKGGYADFGQKVRINYVKCYFKPLVASDSVSVNLDFDYGDTLPLGTITYASDKRQTSKKFLTKRECHAFRPNISWSAGGVAISKIVVDYDFIPE